MRLNRPCRPTYRRRCRRAGRLDASARISDMNNRCCNELRSLRTDECLFEEHLSYKIRKQKYLTYPEPINTDEPTRKRRRIGGA
jgi:hypothetical protein